MKKLIIILIALVAMSCEKSWYAQGYVDLENSCTFIVNDSISVVGDDTYADDICYNVFVNGEAVNLLTTYHFSHYSMKSIIRTMERRYKCRDDTIVLHPKRVNQQCFKY